MLKNKILSFVFIFFSIINFSFAENNNNEKAPLDLFGEWVVFSTVQNNKQICYAMNVPTNKTTIDKKRGESYFIITKAIGKPNTEFVLSSGFVNKSEINSVEIEIDTYKFPLFSFQDKAWSYSIDDDLNIFKLFNSNLFFTIYSKSEGDKYAIDIYSLLGFQEAYKYINDLCK